MAVRDGEPDEARPDDAAGDTVIVEPIGAVHVEWADANAVEPTKTGAVNTEPIAPEVVAPVDPAKRVIYVEAPQPPAKKGNRGFGILLAILATIAYAVLYAGILLIIEVSTSGVADFGYIGAPAFWVPVIYFAVGLIVLVLIANRASWWAYVLGSLLVAVFVYLTSVGTLVLISGIVLLTPLAAGVELRSVLVSPGAFLSALLAREVALWIGAAIASHGRKVKARNVVAREAYDNEVAEKRAERDTTLVGTN